MSEARASFVDGRLTLYHSSDTGVGISEDRLESIFREFEQVSTTGDEKQNGDQPTAAVGLGLAVCARIIRFVRAGQICEKT